MLCPLEGEVTCTWTFCMVHEMDLEKKTITPELNRNTTEGIKQVLNPDQLCAFSCWINFTSLLDKRDW